MLNIIQITQGQRSDQERKEVPLHTFLASSTEMLPPGLSIPLPREALVRVQGGPRMNAVFCGALVQHVWVMTSGGAVVVFCRQMLGQRGDEEFLIRCPDQP